MSSIKDVVGLGKIILANKQILKVSIPLNLFLAKYMGKFTLLNLDGDSIIHSHLPSLSSKAFTRFVDEQLLGNGDGITHAQISLTNACPQNCNYCYNKNRRGERLSTEEIKKLIQKLKELGIFWLGLTGGEPLLNKDLVEIVKSVGDDCAIKLFTTGAYITEQLAAELKSAGLLYVSVSLDHWHKEKHDKGRGYVGAYDMALKAIKIYKEAGLHISVSSVISKDMMNEKDIGELLDFLISIGVHEAWLSEAKPTVEALWNEDAVITESERQFLMQLQDKYNKEGEITVNYLGHFEGGEHFGCNAGSKMIYIDAFGEVSPCVFIPMTFGNVRDKSLPDIYIDMKAHFPTESCCFINQNYSLLKKYSDGNHILKREDSLRLMEEVNFSPLSTYARLKSN